MPDPTLGRLRTSPEVWEVRGGAMQEDGLHGVDGYDVWRGDERADDSFFQDHGDAQEMAERLNDEDEPYYCAVAKTSTAGRCTTVCTRFIHGGQHCGDERPAPRRGEADDSSGQAPLPASVSATREGSQRGRSGV